VDGCYSETQLRKTENSDVVIMLMLMVRFSSKAP